MTQWSFILNYPRAPKGLNANDRSHWRTKARSTQQVRDVVATIVQNMPIPTVERVRVDCVWVVATRAKRDPDNLAPFLKAVYDAIGSDRGVSAHLVADDSPKYMEKVGATIRYEYGCDAHFIITITDIGGPE
jgi:hypothetical protein